MLLNEAFLYNFHVNNKNNTPFQKSIQKYIYSLHLTPTNTISLSLPNGCQYRRQRWAINNVVGYVFPKIKNIYACDCGVFPLKSFFIFITIILLVFLATKQKAPLTLLSCVYYKNLKAENLSHERKRWQYFNDSPWGDSYEIMDILWLRLERWLKG